VKRLVIAGVDEVGRGPLAGPVVAAAVILDDLRQIAELADSKRLTANKREMLDVEIRNGCRAWAIGRAEVEEIDELNILQATMLAMRRAVDGLPMLPDTALVDGNRVPELPCAAESIIGGDGKVAAISAASIVAKVYRDRLMDDLHNSYPEYDFRSNKGYPTQKHRDALLHYGATRHHRRSFAPVQHAIESCGLRID
jgi:ribonuclease HII